MILFRWPFRWGTQDSAASVAVVPLWTKLSPEGANWQVHAAQLEPRFERIYPEGDTGPGFVRITDVVS